MALRVRRSCQIAGSRCTKPSPGRRGRSRLELATTGAAVREQLVSVLLDHLVGASKQSGWHGQSKAPRSFQVHEELDVRHALDGKTRGFLCLKYAPGKNPCLAVRLYETPAIA